MLCRISQFPELNHLEPAQRARVLRQVPWWTYPLIAIRAVIPPFVAIGVFLGFGLAGVVGQAVALVLTLSMALAAAAGLYAYQLRRIRVIMRRTIAEAFHGQRMPFCFRCGYDLRDTATNCPECGQSVRSEASR